MRCPVSHILQDLNPFTELLRFHPLLLVPEEIKKFTSKQSEFEHSNRMGLKNIDFLISGRLQHKASTAYKARTDCHPLEQLTPWNLTE